MTVARYTELALEELIEASLIDHGGWAKGATDAYDAELALIPKDVIAFLESTQPDTWTELRRQHAKNLESTVLEWLAKALESRGTLDVLRHGFKFYGKQLDCCYFKPAHGLNPDIQERFAKNRLTVTRQVHFNPKTDESVDIILSVNGLPVATIELKNQLTGQDTDDAVAQYRRRDHNQKLFQFKKRALVHFAIDNERVAMTTHLAGKGTYFLPFNRGNGGGAGNPPHESGIRTAYLWEDVLARDSFLDILGRFLHVFVEEKEENGKKTKEELLIFPRYHQLDSVRRMIAAAETEGPGHQYLIQHSAGSGKSNSIAWLAHHLASLHDKRDQKVFSSVVVVTDRRILDKQLQDTIYQFEHKQGVVQRIDTNSTQLAEALKHGTPIVITTLQKFPFVAEKIGELPKRNYAVIVDEAHSSQTGESAREMKEILGAAPDEALEKAAQAESESGDGQTYEDELRRVMASRGRQKNLSFFAFTATPKAKTLEAFGRPGPDGKPVAFHLYTMRQAIEEGFILDVLENYTTYKTYFRLVKAIEDDPEVGKKEETKKLARFLHLHPYNLAQKTEVMVEHFRRNVRQRIGGHAKAMVVTASRLHAVRYKQAFDKYIAEKGYPDVKTLVAFSGTVVDEAGLKYTEPGMNEGISEMELPRRFASDDYQVLLVAEKYQTGFDQPLLHTMYVDKKLSGLHAVQTLSRLNRTRSGKTECFVLDFANEEDAIREAFQPYYEWTTVAELSDPQQLYALMTKLNDAQIYTQDEVDALAKVYYAPKGKDAKLAIADMYRFLDPAKSRFADRPPTEQEDFRGILISFVRLYSFLSQVMPFTDPDLEKLYTFARFLQRVLPGPTETDDDLNLTGEADLAYYRLQKIHEGAIALKVAEGGVVYGPTDVGTGQIRDERAKLSEIIDVLNDRFGTEFKQADQLFFDQLKAQAKAEPEVVEKAHANPYDNFSVWLRGKMQGLVAARVDQNADIVARYLDDADFQQVLFEVLATRIYTELRASQQGAVSPGL